MIILMNYIGYFIPEPADESDAFDFEFVKDEEDVDLDIC
jgi:hypothetical protein